MRDDRRCRVEGGDSEGDQLGGPSLSGSWSVESDSPASSPTRTHAFLNCGGEKQREDFSDVSIRGCLQIPDGGNEERDCSQLDPGRGLTSGSAGSSLNTFKYAAHQTPPAISLPAFYDSVPRPILYRMTRGRLSLARVCWCCSVVSPCPPSVPLTEPSHAWFTVTAPLPGLHKASAHCKTCAPFKKSAQHQAMNDLCREGESPCE